MRLDKRVVVIGGTSGIGLAVATALRTQGATVQVVGREDSGLAGLDLEFRRSDLGSFHEVVRLAEWIERQEVQILVHCAGGLSTEGASTPDGYESRFLVNHLSRVLTTEAIVGQRQLERIGFISAWPDYRRPPTSYAYNVPGRGGLMAVNRSYIPNDAYFETVSQRRPDLHVFAFNPGPTRGTRVAQRTGVPWFIRALGPIFNAMARDVDAVGSEFARGLTKPARGRQYWSRGKEVDPPPFTLSPMPHEVPPGTPSRAVMLS